MKTCPVCQRPYADETMVFCLADGTQLINVSRKLDLDATWRFSPLEVDPPPTQIAPTLGANQTDEAKPLSTIQYRPELQMSPPVTASVADRRSRSVLPWLFAIVVVLAASGILIAWILTRDTTNKSLSIQGATPTQQTSPADNTQPKSSAAPEKPSAVDTSAGVSKPASSRTQASSVKTPVAPLTTSTSSRKSSPKPERAKTEVVTQEKKKVEQPKSTGESFIPVKPQER